MVEPGAVDTGIDVVLVAGHPQRGAVRSGARAQQVPPTGGVVTVDLEPRLHEEVTGEHQGRSGQALGDLVTAPCHAEGGPPVPDPVLGEEGGGLSSQNGEVVRIDRRASGEPGSRWHMNQNAAWAAGEMVPMLYDWREIDRQAVSRQRLLFDEDGAYVSEPAQGESF